MHICAIRIPVTSHKIDENKFKTKYGKYRYQVEAVLNDFSAESVTQLRAMVESQGETPAYFFRFRGMGNKNNPGKLVLEIFQLKSKESKRIEMILNSLGEGI